MTLHCNFNKWINILSISDMPDVYFSLQKRQNLGGTCRLNSLIFNVFFHCDLPNTNTSRYQL